MDKPQSGPGRLEEAEQSLKNSERNLLLHSESGAGGRDAGQDALGLGEPEYKRTAPSDPDLASALSVGHRHKKR